MTYRRAFTLIELLVVIAIIAILAAILFPVFAQAKVSAQQTVCISNMKQVGSAHYLYLNDNDDVWAPSAISNPLPGHTPQQPWIGFDTQTGNPFGVWYGNMMKKATNPIRPGALDPYIKNEGVKACPSRKPEWQMALAYNFFSPGYSSAYYSVNPRAAGQEYGPGSKTLGYSPMGFMVTTAASGSEIERPADTIAVWEHGFYIPVCNFLQLPNWFNSPPADPNLISHFNFLHRGGTSTLWCDTHAKRLSYGMLKRPMFSCIKSIYE